MCDHFSSKYRTNRISWVDFCKPFLVIPLRAVNQWKYHHTNTRWKVSLHRSTVSLPENILRFAYSFLFHIHSSFHLFTYLFIELPNNLLISIWFIFKFLIFYFFFFYYFLYLCVLLNVLLEKAVASTIKKDSTMMLHIWRELRIFKLNSMIFQI